MSEAATTAPKATGKRRYKRLTAEEWAKARAAWATGAITADELARSCGCSVRAIQLHMAKHEVAKGSAAAALASAAEARLLADALPSEADLATRIRQTREGIYIDASTIQELVMSNVRLAQDPTTALGAVAALRALDLAATAIGRTQRLRWAALGLDRDSPVSDELPELVIRELTADELTELRERHSREDAQAGQHLPGLEDDDDLVIEGEDEPTTPQTLASSDDSNTRIGGNDA